MRVNEGDAIKLNQLPAAKPLRTAKVLPFAKTNFITPQLTHPQIQFLRQTQRSPLREPIKLPYLAFD
jgi:hypothetical protein